MLSGQAHHRSAPSTTLEPVPTETTPSTAPRPLKLAAAVVAAEGLVLAVLGIVEAITIDSGRLVLGLTTAVFLLLYGAGLLFVARGLKGRQNVSPTGIEVLRNPRAVGSVTCSERVIAPRFIRPVSGRGKPLCTGQ